MLCVIEAEIRQKVQFTMKTTGKVRYGVKAIVQNLDFDGNPDEEMINIGIDKILTNPMLTTGNKLKLKCKISTNSKAKDPSRMYIEAVEVIK